MENEHRSDFETQSAKREADKQAKSEADKQAKSEADRQWSEFERDLDSLGRQLDELQTHTAALGTHFVRSLEASFEDVRTRAELFRKEREVELEQVRLRAQHEAENAFADMRQRSSEAARQVWERSEPLRQGAKDVGVGLARAWVELRTSFGKAAGRLQTETDPNGAAPVASNERHERT